MKFFYYSESDIPNVVCIVPSIGVSSVLSKDARKGNSATMACSFDVVVLRIAVAMMSREVNQSFLVVCPFIQQVFLPKRYLSPYDIKVSVSATKRVSCVLFIRRCHHHFC